MSESNKAFLGECALVLYLALKGDEAGLSEDAMSRIKSECLSDEGMSGTTWGGGDDDEPVSAAARKVFIGMALSDRKDNVASKILELLTRKLVERVHTQWCIHVLVQPWILRRWD